MLNVSTGTLVGACRNDNVGGVRTYEVLPRQSRAYEARP